MKWLLLLAAIVLNAAANVLIKAGMRNVDSAELRITEAWKVLLNVYLVSGVASFALALIAYSLALTKFELSVAYPIMTSLGFIIVGMVSYLWFKEAMSLWRIIGMVVIVAGVYLVARDAR